jgi:hypothetical protein
LESWVPASAILLRPCRAKRAIIVLLAGRAGTQRLVPAAGAHSENQQTRERHDPKDSGDRICDGDCHWGMEQSCGGAILCESCRRCASRQRRRIDPGLFRPRMASSVLPLVRAASIGARPDNELVALAAAAQRRCFGLVGSLSVDGTFHDFIFAIVCMVRFSRSSLTTGRHVMKAHLGMAFAMIVGVAIGAIAITRCSRSS